jgi:hypothetical protein
VASMLGKYFLGKLSGNLTASSKATVATTNSKSDKRCLTDGRFS